MNAIMHPAYAVAATAAPNAVNTEITAAFITISSFTRLFNH